VAALRRAQANLKRYRAAVLKAACEGHLVPTEAELAKTGKRKSTLKPAKPSSPAFSPTAARTGKAEAHIASPPPGHQESSNCSARLDVGHY